MPSNVLLGLLAWRFEGTGLFFGLLIVVIVFALLEARGRAHAGQGV